MSYPGCHPDRARKPPDVKVAGPSCRTAEVWRARLRSARPDYSTEGTDHSDQRIRRVRGRILPVFVEGGRMSIVMGVDQHRAQITAEWIDLASGEISRARVLPADRAGVRRFLERFAGEQLEVALEATTGWRFLVEELRAAGAVVHLAEPAETAALRGNKKRAKSDRADARHHRELLLAGRLPESWIPPDHILDLRAQVRLRHTLIEQHCQWQQRIQAVLYHHGCPHRRQLMEGDGPRVAGRPAAARDRPPADHGRARDDRHARARDRSGGPRAARLRAPADRLQGADRRPTTGSGSCARSRSWLSSATAGGSHNSRDAVRYGGLDITVYQSDRHRAPGHLSRQGPPALRWALYEAAQASRGGRAQPRPRLLPAGRRAARRQPRLPRARAQAAQALLPVRHER